MKITRIETLAADAGYRVASYVKLSTDEGLAGWSEFYDGFAGVPLAPLIDGFGRAAIGMDPRAYARLSESLLATTRLASGVGAVSTVVRPLRRLRSRAVSASPAPVLTTTMRCRSGTVRG